MRHLMPAGMHASMQALARTRARRRGMTLIELMVALAIAAVLALAAAPFLGDYVANARLREGGNLLLTETLFAQSEALKRNTSMRITVSGSAIALADMSDPATPAIVRTSVFPDPVWFDGTSVFQLGSDGRPTPFGMAVSINLKANGATCSAERRCPGLRMDAGGAVRLCGDHTSGCD